MNIDLIHQTDLLGENLRRLRLSKECTVEKLAQISGFSKSFISMVETGKRSIKPMDLRILVQPFGYSLGRFLSEAQDADADYLNIEPQAIVQTKKHTILLDGSRQDGKYHLILLRPMRHKEDIEILDLFLPPQVQMTEENITVDAEIRGIVKRGKLLIMLKNDEFIVREGEECCFDGRIPHHFRNYTNADCSAILIISPPTF